jgi:hypothetical protein
LNADTKLLQYPIHIDGKLNETLAEPHMLIVVHSTKNEITYTIIGYTITELDNRLNLFFSSEGYDLKSVRFDERVFEKGNRLLRNLFGAYFKFYRLRLFMKKEDDRYLLLFQKDLSGISGGLIRENQANKEFIRINEAFQHFFRN